MYADEIRSAKGIFIRNYFGQWNEVSREKAIKYAFTLCPKMIGIPKEKRLDVFNSAHCQGYTVTKEDLQEAALRREKILCA